MPIKLIALSALTILSIQSCQTAPSESDDRPHTSSDSLISEVMTAERQASMHFDDIVNDLLAGNTRFVESHMLQRDHMAQLKQLDKGQHPKAVVLSCIDSRVPVEEVFDQGLGDLFVVRVAGNIDNDHNLGSIEYGCKVAGSKVVIVLGHEHCGAIKSAVKGVDMGNITELLVHIKPTIEKHQEFTGEKSVDNPDWLELITKDNALMTLDDLRSRSDILREMEEKEELLMVAAYYNMHSGEVELLNKEEVYTHMHHERELHSN